MTVSNFQKIKINKEKKEITITTSKGDVFTFPVENAKVEKVDDTNDMKIVYFSIVNKEGFLNLERQQYPGYCTYSIFLENKSHRIEHVLSVYWKGSYSVIKVLAIPEGDEKI